MITRLAATAWALGLLVVSTMACGGGGALTLAEYFEEVERTGDAADERSTEGEGALDDALAAARVEEDEIAAYRSLFGDSLPILDDFVADLKDVNPPDEVAELHSDAIETWEALLELFEDTSNELDDVSSQGELETVLTGFASAEALERATDVCLELQAIADENEIEVELSCEG